MVDYRSSPVTEMYDVLTAIVAAVLMIVMLVFRVTDWFVISQDLIHDLRVILWMTVAPVKVYVQYLPMAAEAVAYEPIIHDFALEVVEDHFVDHDFVTIVV